MKDCKPLNLSYQQAMDLTMSLYSSMNWHTGKKDQADYSFLRLERIQLLSDLLDDVAGAVPTIHIAGTKGKGSVAALITNILTKAGYKTGLFTSPHLYNIRERIRVGLTPITEADYAKLVGEIWPVVEQIKKESQYGSVSFFEFMTGLAMLYFRNIGADFQVLEVGLGGRLDATNIVTPKVSVITAISLDHTKTLGDTIAKIASEKAGIIKTNVPCVVAPQPEPEADSVFEQVAKINQAELISVADRFEWQLTKAGATGQMVELSGNGNDYSLWTPLLGDYQAENIATAVATIEVLIKAGYKISPAAIEAGVKEISWPGRFDVFNIDGRSVVADGAHNPYSIKRLLGSLPKYFEFKRIILVFGVLNGHDTKAILSEFIEAEPLVVAVQSDRGRSLKAGEIATMVSGLGLNLDSQQTSVAAGLKRALDLADRGDLILCTGSLSVASEVAKEIGSL